MLSFAEILYSSRAGGSHFGNFAFSDVRSRNSLYRIFINDLMEISHFGTQRVLM